MWGRAADELLADIEKDNPYCDDCGQRIAECECHPRGDA
jgi:hypothetical protein